MDCVKASKGVGPGNGVGSSDERLSRMYPHQLHPLGAKQLEGGIPLLLRHKPQFDRADLPRRGEEAFIGGRDATEAHQRDAQLAR